MLTVFASFFILGCHAENNKDNPENNNPEDTTVSITLESARAAGSFLAGKEEGPSLFENAWADNGASFDVYVEQDGRISQVGRVESKEKTVSEANRHASLTIDVSVPKDLDMSKTYRVVAVDAQANSVLQGNSIICKVPLERGLKRLPSWYVADVRGGVASTAKASFLCSGECLYIGNATDGTISVKHKGFETAQKWFCSNADVQIVAESSNVEAIPVERTSENSPASPAISIGPGETGLILSGFVPNGNKMTDAALVLEINGKEEHTSPVSSEVSLENGIPYCMGVTWDGQNLAWVGEVIEKEPEIINLSDPELASVVTIDNYDPVEGILEITLPEDKVPAVGDVICSGITPEAPYGFFIKVKSVEEKPSTKFLSLRQYLILSADISAYEFFQLAGITEPQWYDLIEENAIWTDDEGHSINPLPGDDGPKAFVIPMEVEIPGAGKVDYTMEFAVVSLSVYVDARTPDLILGCDALFRVKKVLHVNLSGKMISKKGDLYKKYGVQEFIHTYTVPIGPVPVVFSSKFQPKVPYSISLSADLDMDLVNSEQYMRLQYYYNTMKGAISPLAAFSPIDPEKGCWFEDHEYSDKAPVTDVGREYSASLNGNMSIGLEFEYSVGLFGGNIVEERTGKEGIKYLALGASAGFNLELGSKLGVTKKVDSKTHNPYRVIDDLKVAAYFYGKVWAVLAKFKAWGMDVELGSAEYELKLLKKELHKPMFFRNWKKLKANSITRQGFVNVTGINSPPWRESFTETGYGFCLESADGADYNEFDLAGHPIDGKTGEISYDIPLSIDNLRRNMAYYLYPYSKVSNISWPGAGDKVCRDGISFTISDDGELSTSTIDEIPGELL